MHNETSSQFTILLRKFGVAGFAFFLVKGILWLLAPFVFILFA